MKYYEYELVNHRNNEDLIQDLKSYGADGYRAAHIYWSEDGAWGSVIFERVRESQ